MASEIELIKARAKSLGFSYIGFTPVRQTPHFPEFSTWLKKKQFGSLQFLTQDYVINSRKYPEQLMENAKSVIVLGVSYGPLPYKVTNNKTDQGIISTYAIFEDYHDVVKKKAVILMDDINRNRNAKINYRIFIDSGPMMEKDFAFMAGLGWIGKNSLFIHPQVGSFAFLCCIMVDVVLEEECRISDDLCVNCQLCIEACPTSCIEKNHLINPKRCISYLTIEYKGVIPRELRSKVGNHIFGCDICQDVCPYNRYDKKGTNHQLFFGIPENIPRTINLSKALKTSETEFFKYFDKLPILRLEFEFFLRNVIIAVGNSRDNKILSRLGKLLNHESEQIRIHTVWALGINRGEDNSYLLREHKKKENSQLVLDEISFVLNVNN